MYHGDSPIYYTYKFRGVLKITPVCHLCDTKKVEDEKHFLLDCSAYTHIRSHFENIDHTTNLPNFLTQQKYGDLGKLLLMLFERRNKILNNHK